MAKDDQEEAFEKLMSASLARVIDFNKFAEAKNAALLTFASAWTVASVSLMSNGKVLAPWFDRAFTIALPLFVFAAVLALWSFLPKRKMEIFHRDPIGDKNLLYFDHIADFDAAVYNARVRDRYMPPPEHSASERFLDDLAVQTAVVSRITRRKMALFNFGALIVLLAIAVLAVPALHLVILWLAPLLGGP